MKLLSAQWPEDYFSSHSRPLDDLSTGLDQLIAGIRKYKIASRGFALFVGFLFRYLYGIVKNSILIKKMVSLLLPFFNPFSDAQTQILTVAGNFIADFTASLIPAIICGGLLVYLFGKRASELGIWSVVMLIALGPRFLFFWQAPTVGLKISTLLSPIILTLVFLTAMVLILKNINRITRPSTRRRASRV